MHSKLLTNYGITNSHSCYSTLFPFLLKTALNQFFFLSHHILTKSHFHLEYRLISKKGEGTFSEVFKA